MGRGGGAFSLRRWRRSPLETSRGAEASLQGARFANTICLSSGARSVKGNVPLPVGGMLGEVHAICICQYRSWLELPRARPS